MEKITKEELMKKMNLTEEELEKVTGGESLEECYARADKQQMACLGNCRDRARACRQTCYSIWENERFICHSQHRNQ